MAETPPAPPADLSTAAHPATRTGKVRVWDLPTRLFHWLLAAALIGCVVSAKIGGNAMIWHFRLGYAVFALLAFRLLWGLVGGRWSRFGSFVPSPAALLRYLRGTPRAGEHLDVGHNPLGSLSVWALLTVLAVQVGTGLISDDEIANLGPLYFLVSGETSLSATSWHKTWGQWLVLGLAGLHVAAIAVYRLVLHKDLIKPMLLGDKELSAEVPPSADGLRQRLLAAVLMAACAAGVAWTVQLTP